jgi:hypothetical protein
MPPYGWLLLCLFLPFFAGLAALIHSELARRTPFWVKFQQITWGMTEEEVKDILGPPTEEVPAVSLGLSTSIWVEGEQKIFVEFMADTPSDRVARKRFLPKSLWEELCDLCSRLMPSLPQTVPSRRPPGVSRLGRKVTWARRGRHHRSRVSTDYWRVLCPGVLALARGRSCSQIWLDRRWESARIGAEGSAAARLCGTQ